MSFFRTQKEETHELFVSCRARCQEEEESGESAFGWCVSMFHFDTPFPVEPIPKCALLPLVESQFREELFRMAKLLEVRASLKAE